MLFRRRDDNLESYSNSLLSSNISDISGAQHNYHRLLADPRTPMIKVNNLNNNPQHGQSKSENPIKDVFKPFPSKYY